MFWSKPQPQNPYADYIKQQLTKGYDIYAIRSFLIQKGYPQQEIDQAIDVIYQTPQQHKVTHVIELSNKIWIVMILGLLILGFGIGGFLLYPSLMQPEQLLDYIIQIQTKQLKAGEKLVFHHSFFNTGTRQRYDVKVEYKLRNLDNNEEVDSWSQTIAIATVDANLIERQLPSTLSPGRYKLEGTAQVKKETATASDTFKVYAESATPTCFDNIKNKNEQGVDCGGSCPSCESCFDNLQNQNEEGIDCGGVCEKACTRTAAASCFDGLHNQGEIGIDCGGPCSACERIVERDTGEINLLYTATNLATTKPEEALSTCLKIRETALREQCLTKVAKDADNYTYCSRIATPSQRDTCFMHFVINKNEYSICNQLNNEYVKSSCDALKRSARIYEKFREQQELNNTEASNQ